MYYFDNKYLQQYVDAGSKLSGSNLKVYVNQEWYNITSLSDLQDPIDGIGYDEYGGDHRFDYKSIESIQIGGRITTLDQLQTQMTGKPDDSSKEEPKPADAGDEPDMGSDAPEEEPEEEPSKGSPPKGKKGPDLSWFSPAYDIGRQLMQEHKRKRK